MSIGFLRRYCYVVLGFPEVCRRRGLRVNAGKSKVMVLNGEEGLECEVHVDGVRFGACLLI